MAVYTKDSGADQAQIKRRPMAVYNRIVAQTNRIPSADQWQCTQRIVAQTNHRPSADQWQCTQRVVAQTKRRPMVLRGYWFGKLLETFRHGVQFSSSQSSHKTVRGAAKHKFDIKPMTAPAPTFYTGSNKQIIPSGQITINSFGKQSSFQTYQ